MQQQSPDSCYFFGSTDPLITRLILYFDSRPALSFIIVSPRLSLSLFILELIYYWTVDLDSVHFQCKSKKGLLPLDFCSYHVWRGVDVYVMFPLVFVEFLGLGLLGIGLGTFLRPLEARFC